MTHQLLNQSLLVTSIIAVFSAIIIPLVGNYIRGKLNPEETKMDAYTASKYDLQERLHPDDRAEAGRYDWERQHREMCPMDRTALIETVKEQGGRLVPHVAQLPCCVECFVSFWQHEVPGIVLEAANVIDLHPNRAA